MIKKEVTLQSPEDIRIQKCRFSLLASGNAMILFSIWTVVRTIMDIRSGMSQLLGESVPIWDVTAVVLAISCVELILKLIVGFSATAEGRGGHRNGIYIVLGFLVVGLSVYDMTCFIRLMPFFYEYGGFLRAIVSTAVEATVIYAALDLVISAIMIRRIQKQAGTAECEEG